MGKLRELYTPFIFTSHLKFAATKEEFYMKLNTDSVKYSQYPNFYFSTLSSFKKQILQTCILDETVHCLKNAYIKRRCSLRQWSHMLSY